ncbi:MAG: helix-turn-helix domain-containing protein [Alphaproteobacteria bacterium]
METFGEIIKSARKKRGLYLRQVASALDVDQALISKFEKGDRKPSKEQVIKFANFFEIDKDELITAWLSDKIIYTLQGEENAENALKVAEQRIKYGTE